MSISILNKAYRGIDAECWYDWENLGLCKRIDKWGISYYQSEVRFYEWKDISWVVIVNRIEALRIVLR